MQQLEIVKAVDRAVTGWCERNPEYRRSSKMMARGDYRKCEEDDTYVACDLCIILTNEQKNDQNIMTAIRNGVRRCCEHVIHVKYFTPEEWAQVLPAKYGNTANLALNEERPMIIR